VGEQSSDGATGALCIVAQGIMMDRAEAVQAAGAPLASDQYGSRWKRPMVGLGEREAMLF
jgi:hypothetical protein